MTPALTGRIYLAMGLTLFYSVTGHSATVYKSVDEQGVVSFSDTRPSTDAPVETLQIKAEDPQLSAEDQDRLQAMRETTDRMASDRREREKHRAEMRQLQANSQPTGNYGGTDYTDYMGYSSGYSSNYSGYYGYPQRRPGHRPGNRPGHKPGYRPKPEHPIARPPMRPQVQAQRGSNSQLMRPIVSPRR